MQWLQVGILAGSAHRERQCMYRVLQGEAQYVNVHGNVQCGEVQTGGEFF